MAGVLAVSGGAACSALVDSDRVQCADSDDCRGRRGLSMAAVCVTNICVEAVKTATETDAGVDTGPVDPVWGCLGTRTPMPEEPTVPVRYTTRLTSVLGNDSRAGVAYRACPQLDDTCSQPLEGTIGKTNAEAVLEIMLYKGFRGYIDLTPPEGSSMMHALINPLPIGGELPQSSEYSLLNTADLTTLVGIIDRKLEPEDGHIFFAALDCAGVPAANVRVRASAVTAESFSFYTDQSGAPSISQEFTVNGGAGFINLPPGVVEFTVTRSTGELIAKRSFVIRANSASYTYIGPGL